MVLQNVRWTYLHCAVPEGLKCWWSHHSHNASRGFHHWRPERDQFLQKGTGSLHDVAETLPIALCLLLIAYCQLIVPIAYCPLPIVHSLLPIVKSPLPIAHCPLPAPNGLYSLLCWATLWKASTAALSVTLGQNAAVTTELPKPLPHFVQWFESSGCGCKTLLKAD